MVLTFSYQVTDDDTDIDGISSTAPTFDLPSTASITRLNESAVAAYLGPILLSTDFAVNVPPLITGVEVTSTPKADPSNDTYGLGEDIEITVTFSEAVNVTGDIDFGLSVGGAKRARLKSGNGTAELVFAYTVQAGDTDTNGIFIGNHDSGNATFDLQSGQSVVGVDSGREALLEHDEQGTKGDHKVDGALTGADATLSALSLSGITLDQTFTAGAAGTAVTSFTATTSLSSTTVTATASQSGGSSDVDIDPGDADTAAGHQVNLDVGDTVITVTVTSSNGASMRAYTVTVTSEAATDTTAPAVSSATVSAAGAAIDIVFDEPLDETSTPSTTAFLAGISGIQTDRAVPNNVAVSGDTVTLTIRSGNTIAAGAIVTLAYTAPSTNALADASGNEVESFTGTDAIPVLNRPAAPVVTLTAGDGQLTATWAAPANGGSAITGYDVEWKTAAQTWAEAATAGQSDRAAADATDHEITSLTNNTEYTVRVRAANGAGNGPWSAEASETPAPQSDDCPNDATTTCEVDVGGSTKGNIETAGDRDWFKVVLEADTRYQIDVEGDDTGRGTVGNPDAILYDASSTRVSSNDDGGVDENGRLIYAPTAAGAHYVLVSEATTVQEGTYTVSVIVLGANGASEADTDFPATTSTTGRVEVGASATGTIGADNDDDWFRVDLEAGKTYQFDLEGADTGRGTQPDPYVVLVNPSATIELEFDDHGGVGKNARLIYVVDETGTYYVDAGPGNDEQGTYTLSVRDITPPDDLPAGTTTTGVVEVDGSAARSDIHKPVEETATWTVPDDEGNEEVHEQIVFTFDTDWFAVELEEGRTYRIDMKGAILADDDDLTLPLPQINAIYNKYGDFLVNTFDSDESDSHYLFRVTFHAYDDGTYYIAASGESFEWGTYELTVIDITRDVGDYTNVGDDTNVGKGLKNLRAVEEKGGVRLTWQPPDGAAVTGYRIERRRADEQGSGPQRSHGQPRDHHTLVEDTGNTETSYVDESAEQGVEYEYRVTARNESGPGEESDWVRAGPEEEPVLGDGLPGAPRNLTATPGNREVSLSWDPPADNGNAPATRYRIEWRVDGQDYGTSQWGTSRETTYTTNDQANLANGVKYFFRVKAENGSGNSYGPYGPASEEVSATPTSGSAVDLGTPVLSDTETLHHGMVRLDWEDIEDAGWYVVQHYHLEDEEWLGPARRGSGHRVPRFQRGGEQPAWALVAEGSSDELCGVIGVVADRGVVRNQRIGLGGCARTRGGGGRRDRAMPRGPGHSGAVGHRNPASRHGAAGLAGHRGRRVVRGPVLPLSKTKSGWTCPPREWTSRSTVPARW